MRREWEPEELIGAWTLVEADGQLLANKTGASRLGFALALKFFEMAPCSGPCHQAQSIGAIPHGAHSRDRFTWWDGGGRPSTIASRCLGLPRLGR